MKYCIADLAQIIDGDRGKNYPKQNDFLTDGFCLFLNTGNVTKTGFSFENKQFISQEKSDSLRKGKLQRGDIVYTTRGTVGNAALFDNSIPYDHVRINSGMVILRPFTNIVCTEFLYQILKSDYYRPYIQKYCTGSAQPQLPIKTLSKIKLEIPSLKTQKRIADVLSAYDDLIENNERQIRLLEEAAQRLYKEWFIRLHFPGYESTPVIDGVPEGWEKVPLQNLIGYEIGGGWGSEFQTKEFEKPAFVIRGTDFPGVMHGNFTELPFRYHADSNLKARILLNGDIIFEVSGGSRTEGVARTVLVTQALLDFLKFPVMCASFCKLVRPADPKFSAYLFATFQYLRQSGKTAEFDKRSASSIVNYRWKDFLIQQDILIPTTNIMIDFNKIFSEIYQKAVTSSISISILQEARDRLLPRLMLGEAAD